METTDCGKVNIIAHSKGGLDSRAAIAHCALIHHAGGVGGRLVPGQARALRQVGHRRQEVRVRVATQKWELDEVRAESEVCKTKYPLLMVHGVFFRDFRCLNYWGRIPRELTAKMQPRCGVLMVVNVAT